MIVTHPRHPSLRTRVVASALPEIARPWLFVVALAGALALSGHRFDGLAALGGFVTPVGLALSIFLGFRNNACYDRWWEARRLWGGLINTVRTVARQASEIPTAPPDDAVALEAWRRGTVRMLVAWTHALKDQLRTRRPDHDLAPWLDADVLARVHDRRSVPLGILQELSARVADARRRGWLDTVQATLLEQGLAGLSDIQGGCERIKNTPVPYAYTALTHRIVGAYLLAVPFAVLPTAGWATPIVTGLVAFAFLGLDAVGTQIEDPFETDANDLPLSAITRVVEIDLLQVLGEADVPEPLEPVDGLLL